MRASAAFAKGSVALVRDTRAGGTSKEAREEVTHYCRDMSKFSRITGRGLREGPGPASTHKLAQYGSSVLIYRHQEIWKHVSYTCSPTCAHTVQ